jgi:hypothetical protein
MMFAVPLLLGRTACYTKTPKTPKTPTRRRTTTTTTTTPSRRTPARLAKSAAKDNVIRQLLTEELSDKAYFYNAVPGTFENNVRESGGRRGRESGGRRGRVLPFSPRDNVLDIASPPRNAVKSTLSTPTPTGRAGQDMENHSPLGNLDDETVVSPGQDQEPNQLWKDQMHQVTRQVPQEFRSRQADQALRQTQEEYAYRDWKHQMDRVVCELLAKREWTNKTDQVVCQLQEEFVNINWEHHAALVMRQWEEPFGWGWL